MEKKLKNINGIDIRYFDEGDPSQPCVLMLHGFPESSLIWRDTIRTVCNQGLRAVAPDLPGFGQSNRFHEPSTWERYVQFVSEFLVALEVNDVHLFVHDWGGLIGLRWGMDHLNRVKSLLISDTTISTSYTWHDLAQKLRTAEVGEKVLHLMSRPVPLKQRFSSMIPGIEEDVLNDFYRLFSSEGNHRTTLELYRSGDTEKLVAYAGKLLNFNRPATIVWGEDDPYIGVSHAFELRDEYIPNGVVHVIPKAGHFIHLEASEQFQKIVEEHLSKI